jgi:hypothetical protein
MKAKARNRVIGRTITAVETTTIWNDRYPRKEVVLNAFVLDDGTRIVFGAGSTNDDNYATADVVTSRGSRR